MKKMRGRRLDGSYKIVLVDLFNTNEGLGPFEVGRGGFTKKKQEGKDPRKTLI